jgi:(E)-4-hydroxy-3-methylbut-2-enyl-diphosphate synthase
MQPQNMKTPPYCPTLFAYQRRQASEVKVGQLVMGGHYPIRLQSMTTTNTLDTEGTVAQSLRIVNEGGELVRITTQGRREASNLEPIRNQLRQMGCDVPLVADIHFNPNAAEIAASLIEKVRINPGNFADGAKKFATTDTSPQAWQEGIDAIREKLIPFLNICKQHDTAIRIGVNHGSLSDRIMSRYGDTPEGMVESCMEFLRICRAEGFHKIVLSIKSSNTRVMVHTVRLLVACMNAEQMHYPLHLGVTEAGNGEDGRIKSAVGIGALLADGIGDTIRVSLTEDPELEIPVARKLVNYITQRAHSLPIPFEGEPNISPFVYHRRSTQSVMNVGGNHTPVIIHRYDAQLAGKALMPDFVICNTPQTSEKALKDGFRVICPQSVALPSNANVFPMVDAIQFDGINLSKPHFLRISYTDLTPTVMAQLQASTQTIIIATTTHVNGMAEQRALIFKLMMYGITAPVVIERSYDDADAEDLQIKAGADAGILFLDGLADGLMLNAPALPQDVVLSTAFGVLQASRVRFTKTEYISCPGCGRTLFDLQTVTAQIKARTSHLKELKIGIMGCIVNGIGEMADADYGYIGSGPGTVSLFKQKEMVKRNIPTEHALEELIELIKENGDWKEA